MYEGLTINDKHMLESAKARGMKNFSLSRGLLVDIDAALAQIAEMEAERKSMTVNEWLNQATPEQKAEWMLEEGSRLHNEATKYAYIHETRIEGSWFCKYKKRMTELLNSPYTEGATK